MSDKEEIEELKARIDQLEKEKESFQDKQENLEEIKETLKDIKKKPGCLGQLWNALLGFFLILIFLAVVGGVMDGCSSETPLEKAHKEYQKRSQGYQSSNLPREGTTRGDDYRNCIDKRWHLDEDPHDFCSWHAGIGKYK